MKIFYQNVNRIRSKLQQLYINILSEDYDVICLCETSLDSSFSNSKFVDDRYTVFRRDRETTGSSKKSGGGVLIALKKNLFAVRRTEFESSLEDLWITVREGLESRNPSLNIYLVYLPPDLSIVKCQYFYDHCYNTLLNCNNRDSKTIILGDFNIPGLTWSLDLSSQPRMLCSKAYDFKSALLVDLLELGGLFQYNHVRNSNDRILDLIMTDLLDLSLSECSPLSTPDRHHPANRDRS